ncbi:T9SS type A sorting domain-containing protein [Longimonas halophila]|nr:T9SS type A sorting domain-containing protein [Longimonas halophila]
MRNGFDSLRSALLRRVVTPLLVIFIAGFITDAHTVYAQQIHALDSEIVDSAQADIYGTDRTSKDGPLSRVGFDLALLYREYEAYEASGAPEPFQSKALQSTSFESGRVTIDATARRGDAEALAASLREAGALHVSRFQNVVSARIPIKRIPAVAALPELNAARRAVAATPQPQAPQNGLGGVTPRVGATDSQGDAAMNTDDVRTTFGIDGSGRTIGVLSDSYDTSSSASTDAADDISTGDLPPADRIDVLDDSITGSDEGRAMMQLIFDVAPGSDLAFHTAFGGQAGFANGIIELRDAGSDVIVDDVFYFTEPFFQDGIIAQAVDEVTGVNTGDPDDGVPYFSSAGNNADQSYESETPSFVSSDGTVAYDFDPSAATDTQQQITVPVSGSFRLSLQWDDPYVSVTGDPNTAADTDLDIFVLDQSGTVVAQAANDNISSDPIEFLQFTNDGSFDADGDGTPDETFNLYIENFDGPNPGRIKYIYGGNLTIEEYATNSPTSFGHSIAEGGAGVGASAWFQSPEFGTSPAVPESFTSLGGNAILFNLDGTRKTTPEVRDQPRITGPDGGNTTFFGQSLNDGDSFPNFFGTSASAPHVAGLAALQLQADASLSPTDIYTAQANGAANMESPGFDFLTGAGFVNAENTITSLAGDPAITVAPTAVGLGTLFFDTSSGTLFNVPTVDIQVENIGSAPLDITNVTLTGTSFAFTGGGIPTGSLPIGDAITATIEFAPGSTGTYSESLTITSNDPDESTVTIPLEADVVLPPVIDVPAASLFEAVETGQSATQSLTVANSGGTALDYDIFAEATGLGSFTPNEVAATASVAPTARSSSNLLEAGLASAPSTSSGGGLDPSEFIYTLDDGSSENNIGITSGADILWLNAFETQDGAATITAIASAFGTSLATGSPVEFLLYDDPNNDGDPTDATLLTSVTTQSDVSGGDQLQVEPITPTTVSGVFFVAVLAPSSTTPAPIDETTDVGASWVGTAASGAFDTTDLSGLSPIADAGFPGNWLLRAQGSFVAFEPVSGTVAAGTSETVDVTFDGTTLPVDTYDGNIAIHSNDPVNGQLSRPFDFFVADAVGEVANVNADGSYAFGNTGLTTNLTGVSGSGTVTAARFDTPPSNTNGIDASFDVSPYRWIVVQDNDLQFDAASVLRFERSAIPAPGFDEANGPNVTVYRRGTPDTGTFGALTTTYDNGGTTGDLSDDVLDATGATGFSEFVLASDAAPLPVELTTFDAALNADQVVLSWRTASETNNVGFEVQRMATSRATDEGNASWQTLTMLDGAGTTDEPQQYQFEDTDLPFAADSLSYRLRQVDSDGTEHITDPVSVERSVNQVELLPTYPNPARDHATLRYAAPPQQRVRIALYDMLGRRVRMLFDGTSNGRTEVQMDLSRLSSGTYFLQLQSNGTIKTQRVTVVR